LKKQKKKFQKFLKEKQLGEGLLPYYQIMVAMMKQTMKKIIRKMMLNLYHHSHILVVEKFGALVVLMS